MKKTGIKKRRRVKKPYRYLFRGVFTVLLFVLVMQVYTIYSQHVESHPAKDVQERTANINLEKKLKSNWQAIDNKDDRPLSVAIQYKGHIFSYQSEVGELFKTASIVKVSVAVELLHNSPQGMTQDEQNLLSDMITYSDNDSTTELLMNYLDGYTSLNQVFKELNMPNTKVDPAAWGYTVTTASDQMNVLNTIFNQSTYLDTDSQKLLRELMGQITSEQSWGIGQLQEKTAFKNGWLLDDDGWIVNSIGSITFATKGQQQYQMAILTKGNSSLQTGIDLVEEVAEKTNKIMQTKG